MKKLLFIYFIIIILTSQLFSQTEIDSLIKLVDTTWANVIDTNKVNTLNELAWEIKTKESDKAIEYSNKAIEISETLEFKKGKAEAFKNLGGIYYLQTDYYKAFENYTTSLEIFKEINDKESVAKVIRNIGSVYHQQANYEMALEYFEESLRMRIEMDDKEGEASLYNAIGLVYSEQGEGLYDKALEYYNKALRIFEKIKDTTGITASYYRIGDLFTQCDTPKYDNALNYFILFNEYVKKSGTKRQLAQSLDALGFVYLKKNQPDSAYNYLLEANEIWITLNNQYGIANSLYYIGLYYKLKLNFTKSINYCLKALQIANQALLPEIEKKICYDLKENYEKLGNTKQALFYFNRYAYLLDSLQTDEVSKQLAQYELQKDFDEKIKEKELIEIQNQAKLKQQRIVIIFFIAGFLLLIGLFFVIIRSYRLLKSKNIKIQEQNEMLHQQNEEIEAQRDEIEQQRDIVIQHRDEIAQQKQHITDSIFYAKHIQNAILPPEELIKSVFPDILIFYRPRDIVSGDFYWIERKGNKKIICCSDCTGHGVPGAFMSMLGISFLNEILNEFTEENIAANLILNRLRDNVKKSLHQTDVNSSSKDGMDIALCVVDTKNQIVQFAGANNPLLFVRNGEVTQIDADKMPIGVYIKEKESFTNNEIQYQKDDSFYLFSDGFVDQFGGVNGKKYMIKNFRILISQICSRDFKEQETILNEELNNWINHPDGKEQHQIDDISIVAFKLKKMCFSEELNF